MFQRIVDNVSEQLGFTIPVLGLPNSMDLLNSAKVFEPFASIEFDDNQQVSVGFYFMWRDSETKSPFLCQAIVTLPTVINYALRFPAELRPNGSIGSSESWATNFKLGNSFDIGPRNKEDNDGGEPPGYIKVKQTISQIKDTSDFDFMHKSFEVLANFLLIFEVKDFYVEKFCS